MSDIIYTKSQNFVFRQIADEMILVPISRNTADMENIYTLNETAAHIWQQIDGHRTIGELCDQLVAEYDVDRVQAEADVSGCIQQLCSIKALLPV